MTKLLRSLAGLAGISGLIVLAACSSSGSGTGAASPSSTPASTASSASSSPTSAASPGAPQRIVSMSPSATETLYAIGAGKQVVAVDSYSTYPADAPKTDMEAFSPNAEAIAKYSPDLVIVSGDTNGIVSSLRQLKIDTAVEQAPTTIDGAYDQIVDIGQKTGHQAEAEKLVSTMKSEIAATVSDTKSKVPNGMKIYHEVDKTYYSADSTSFIGQIYAQFGVDNIADAAGKKAGGYPQLSAEKIVGSAPNAIFLADAESGGQSPAVVSARPGWSTIPAVAKANIFVLNEDIASRWGPRIVDLTKDVGADLAAAAAKK